MSKKAQQLLAIAGFAVVLVVVLIVVSQGGSDSGDSRADTGLLNGIEQAGTSLGDPDAPYTLVEFADLQCPFCAEYDRNVLPTVVDDYVRAGKLRLEFRPLTFIGPDSETAARFALGLGQQDKLWNFIDLAYHEQGAENSGYVDEAFLTGLADQIPGADADKAAAAADSGSVTKELQRAKTEAQEAGIESTPSFLIGPTGGDLAQLEISQLDPDSFSEALDSAMAG